MGDTAMVMGDLVLTEQEINPVMVKLLAGGITVTAVHNHLLRAQPAIFYMHVAGRGDGAKLASALHDALGASATPFGTAAAPVRVGPVSPGRYPLVVHQIVFWSDELSRRHGQGGHTGRCHRLRPERKRRRPIGCDVHRRRA
jgi:hypothetical protein